MVSIEVKLYGVNKIAKRKLGKPDKIKEAWLFEAKMENGKWPNKLGAIGEVGEWIVEIDKENVCFKGREVELDKELGIEEAKQSIYKLEFEENAGIILGIDDKPIKEKNKRRFWKDGNVKLIKKKGQDDEEEQPPTTPTDTNYRYCFSCDKWLKKSEVNKVDWGEQPGGGNGECWHCSYCRKQLGDDSQTQIFRCHKHSDEILKVWGVLDGENKEKIFFKECPQEQKEHQPSKGDEISGGAITVIVIVIVLILGGAFGVWYWKKWKETKNEDKEY